PALIEKVRSAVTDGQGQYNIVNLVSGTYTVKFTLPGFTAVRREGIELTLNFSAQVNAVLQVGDLAETITVSGESPGVDLRNVVQRRVVQKEVLDTLPSARVADQLALSTIPGMTSAGGISVKPVPQDVGGTSSEGQVRMQIHGGRS